jgi:hypothetical protein
MLKGPVLSPFLSADVVTTLEAGPVCSPVTMMYRLLAKL